MNNVNLNSLRIFLEVASSKSFLDASNKLFISQPAISKSMSKLEEELNKIDYDIMLFIPYGCYKFLNLFLDENNYKKVMFLEIHIDQNKPNIHKLYAKKLKIKKY